jgi:hypothetical protein
VRTLARIAIIAFAAAWVVELTGFYADFRPRSANLHRETERRWETERRRCPAEPHLDRLPSFLGEFALIGAIAFAGRKVLRLRLVDSRLP